MNQNRSRIVPWACIVPLAMAVGLTACGGGGGGSSTTTTTTNSDGEVVSSVTRGLSVPSEISAVPASSSASSSSAVPRSLGAAVRSLAKAATAGALPADSDYATTEARIYVEERALEQFDIVEQIFKALAQTHYADEANVNNGPYKAMIAWEDDEGGKSIKTLETWTVESRMIVVTVPSDVTGNDTGDVNRLMAWIPEVDEETGEEETVKAEFKIYSAPSRADDGSLLNFGEWDMNVLFEADAAGVDTIPSGGPRDYFAASARVAADGTSTLKVHDKFTESFGPGGTDKNAELKGVLVRAGDDGYGKVSYPDWDTCWQSMGGGGANPCETSIPVKAAQYSYNANYMGVQEIDENGVAASAVYKDRNLDGAIRVVHRYGLFYADGIAGQGIIEGDNLEKHKSFGFPVSYTRAAQNDATKQFSEFAFYGAWQGRHQLWGPGGITAGSTVLTRQDWNPADGAAPTYKLKEFDGSFTKRTLVTANLDDIKNIPVETWLSDHYDLFYFDPDGGGAAGFDWHYCSGYIDWMAATTPPTCRDKATNNVVAMTALTGSSLLTQLPVTSGERRWVSIGRDAGGMFKQYVYLNASNSSDYADYTTPGFYEADWGMQGLAPKAGAQCGGSCRLTEADGMSAWVDIGGSIFIAYTGDFDGPDTITGWVQKTMTGFDTTSWVPTFDPAGDSQFTPARGQEYYMNAKGQNYVVKRIGNATSAKTDYSAKLELQTAANPLNTDSSAATPASILPTGTAYLAAPWNKDVKYGLIENPADSNYLLLEVAHDSTNTLTPGDVGASDVWGLVAYKDVNGNTNLGAGTGFDDDVPMASDGTALTVDAFGWVDPNANGGKEPMQFNYEYAGNDGQTWGKQQFLYRDDGSLTSDDYLVLSDPVTLNNVQLYNNLGAEAAGEIVSLQFDGWMHGLPDMYHELAKNNWDITGLGDKVRRLLEGQKVTDSNGVSYFVKPLDTSLFLGVVNAFPAGPQPDVTQGNSVDLNSVPTFTAHGMGAVPTEDADGNALTVKYSEGKAL